MICIQSELMTRYVCEKIPNYMRPFIHVHAWFNELLRKKAAEFSEERSIVELLCVCTANISLMLRNKTSAKSVCYALQLC